MNAVSRLGLHVLAWAASIPVLNVGLTALERHHVLLVSAPIAAIAAAALLLWVALIYWRCVPHRARGVERGVYLLVFAVSVLSAGVAALFVAFWATVALFGL
jgi:hypothetical protein